MAKARCILHEDEREYTDEQIEELAALGLLAGNSDEPVKLPPGGFGLGVVAAAPPVPVKNVKAPAAAAPAKEAK
jgi:hypothetical protein